MTTEARTGSSRLVVAKGLCVGLVMLAGIASQHLAWAEQSLQSAGQAQRAIEQQAGERGVVESDIFVRKRAYFKNEKASLPARNAADWIVDSGDNLGMPFMIIDKAEARVLMFDAHGQLTGSASALLGLARGDDSVPGIGERKLSSIRPEERTTPAGRFVASLGRNLAGDEILWVDYEAAISLHRVVPGTAKERRAERLASPHVYDKRISYGCINVPVAFFDSVVIPAFTGTNGVVYTLPETRDNHTVFNSYYEPEL